MELFRRYKPFKLIRQLDMMGCGPSCLAMIMEYYGKSIDIKEINAITYMSRSGVSLRSISKAAESLGFNTMGGCISIDTLLEKANLPCIVYWEQSHFVVVYQIERNKRTNEIFIHVADPVKALVKYRKEEFCNYWFSTQSNQEQKGIVLLLRPTEVFYSKGTHTEPKKKDFSMLRKYVRGYNRFFVQLVGGLFVLSVTIGLPFFDTGCCGCGHRK